ncbi:hypothetical protein [Enterovibrio paralichthyis]|uniref:hypothetical protein n=1 Tax=Enterovibrio paralichthyis TaxID=2853805 RepID=UPI001C466E1E|nr:hypothetical protein [Enterovibrio paralichthyis]MBV7300380.1 hypothetical protein [Enterovibrio paralichthyis]
MSNKTQNFGLAHCGGHHSAQAVLPCWETLYLNISMESAGKVRIFVKSMKHNLKIDSDVTNFASNITPKIIAPNKKSRRYSAI